MSHTMTEMFIKLLQIQGIKQYNPTNKPVSQLYVPRLR